MGTWGLSIRSDDTVLDVREEFKDLVKQKQSIKLATEELIKNWKEEISDPDDGPLFWLGLADVQWEYGGVDKKVLAKVKSDYKHRRGLGRWTYESEKLAAKRLAAVEKFIRKIERPNPSKKPIPKQPSRKPKSASGVCRIGAIVEIPTRKGLAYAQFTHDHKENWGPLIRVFDKLFRRRPTDFAKVSELPVRFSVFFPLNVAVRRKLFEIVGHAEVRPDLRPFPIFRAGGATWGKKVAVWYLWDGKKEWRVGKITKQQRKLPLRECWDDTALVESIEKGWRPETDPR